MTEKKTKLLNSFVNNVTMDEALHFILKRITDKQKSRVVALNVDVLVKMDKDKELTNICNTSDLVLTDGKPLIWISKLFNRPIKEKVSGSDLVPKLFELLAQNSYSTFIIGGKEGIADKAALNLRNKFPSLNIVGTYSPPFGFEKDEKELKKINMLISERKPDVLIACFGCPKQEKWVFNNFKKYDATVSICAGATVDFLAGNIKRCPKWISNAGFEWLFRITQDPKRLIKRYLVDDLAIIKLLFKYK